jgi:catechol 2,3-dioxygenase-like lactoylglutathione lyase family enzyme
MFEKVDHVTIVVKDMDKALKAYENILNLVPGGAKGFIKNFGDTRLAMFTIAGARVELMQPGAGGGQDNPFAQFLAQHGDGVYSYCVYVQDFDKEIARLKKMGVKLREGKNDFLFPGYTIRIAWVLPEEGLGVAVELVDAAVLPDFEK